jgi:hypothetical protein
MEKLRFQFTVEASSDGKNNVIHIKSITIPDGRIFKIPIDYQHINLHEEIKKNYKLCKSEKNTD